MLYDTLPTGGFKAQEYPTQWQCQCGEESGQNDTALLHILMIAATHALIN
jgi:hypothetical protein